MTSSNHTTALLEYLQASGITTPESVKPGWTHIGGVIVDAVLQPQRSYENLVYPRVRHVINTYPEAATTSGFLDLLQKEDPKDVMQYQSDDRASIALNLATTFQQQNLNTVEEIRTCFQTPDEKSALLKNLQHIRGVGPKTANYVGILVGDPESFAIDARIRKVLKAAGIPRLSYNKTEKVIRDTAAQLGWHAGALDATLWKLDI